MQARPKRIVYRERRWGAPGSWVEWREPLRQEGRASVDYLGVRQRRKKLPGKVWGLSNSGVYCHIEKVQPGKGAT